MASRASSAVARLIDSRHATPTVPFTAPVAFNLSRGTDLLDSMRTTSVSDTPLTLRFAAPCCTGRAPGVLDATLGEGLAPFAGFSLLTCAVVTASLGA